MIVASRDSDIEDAAIAVITADSVFTGVAVDARKMLVLRESESTPRVMLRCNYDKAFAGDSDDDHRINAFYTLTIRLVNRNNKAITGTETLKVQRDRILQLLFGPTLSGASFVDDMRPIKPQRSALPQLPEGVDSEVLAFEVETYEGLT